MKPFAVVADLQFDAYARLSTPHPSGLPSRLVDMVECWRWVVKTAREAGCHDLIVLGDVFESRTAIDLPVLDTVCREFHDASVYFSNLFIVVGNHDSYLRNPKINSTQAFSGYANVIAEPHRHGPYAFVPWTDDPDDFRQSIAAVSKPACPYLFAHVLVAEAVKKANSGVSLSDLKPDRWEHVFLGDVHDPLEVAPNVRYVGSPLQIDYRDAGKRRGFYVVEPDLGDAGLRYVENDQSPRFHLVTEKLPPAVGPRDFVRVRCADPDKAASLALAAQDVTPWVEADLPDADDQGARLAVAEHEGDEALLAAYAGRYAPEGEVEALVKAGLEILAES